MEKGFRISSAYAIRHNERGLRCIKRHAASTANLPWRFGTLEWGLPLYANSRRLGDAFTKFSEFGPFIAGSLLCLLDPKNCAYTISRLLLQLVPQVCMT